MGTVKTLKGEDGRPYISLEDLIKEVEEAKKYNDSISITSDIPESSNFINVVLKTLRNMEIEYYNKLFKNK